MKGRCYNSNADSYHNYGGKGITVCDDWKNDLKKFYDWAIDHNWVKGLCIDRIDNKKGYYPENCRIITRSENTKKIFIDNPECFRGINNHGAILTDDKVREIRKRITLGEPSYIIAKEMKVSKTTICQVKYYKRWKHVL